MSAVTFPPLAMDFHQPRPADEIQRALVVGLVAAGATFIVVLVSVALMLLVVDPAKVTATVDRPLLLPKETPDATAPDAANAPEAPPADGGPEKPRG